MIEWNLGELFLQKHGRQRALEWSFPIEKIKEALGKGFHEKSKTDPSCMLCIYKVQEQYFTIVYKKLEKRTYIITVYHSNPEQIKTFEGKLKK